VDKAVIAKTVADELAAASDCMIAGLNSLAGPYGKAYGRCVGDLYYACFHLSSALLASRGIEARSHEAVQKLIALHFVKSAALPQDTPARFNELMDKRHVADYKPYIAIGPEDIVALRPWISGFVRNVLRLLDGRAPGAAVESLLRLANQLEAAQVA
jgi:uncharacterized protein (UPF0332 family)